MTAPGETAAALADVVVVVLSRTVTSPTVATITTTIGGVAIIPLLMGVVAVVRKLTGRATLDALTRMLHVRGRNRAQDTLAAALAHRGDPEHLLRGLQLLRQVSPMDAPDADLYTGDPSVTAVLAPRTTPESRVVIVRGEPPTGR